MSVEIHDKLIALLATVGELKAKEVALKTDKERLLGQIAQSAEAARLCDDELGEVREQQLRLRREMDGLRDELFGREGEEEIIGDEASVPTNGEGLENSSARRAWDERAKHLNQVR
jgi:hypothetical protein